MRQKDAYTKKAKAKGLRARSAYKLKQIQKSFNIIKEKDKVLDLGCWPGGWSIVAKNLGAEVIGIDLDLPKKVDGVTFIQEDVFSDTVLTLGKFNVILSDLSPKKSGVKSIDQELSIELVKRVLFISQKLLKNKGIMLCKYFQGKDIDKFIKEVRKHFKMVKTIKPKASKKESREMYLLAKDFL